MPLFVWKKLSLSELTPTRMTLELADRSVAHPKGVAEDVLVNVGKFYFPVDFVVVDYDFDTRVPLILGRPFLRTARALIDVHGEELTLRVNDEAITMLKKCSDFRIVRPTSGNPTPSDPIIASSSPSFTPFEGGDFILEEIEACLLSDSIPPGIDDADFDPEGDIPSSKIQSISPLSSYLPFKPAVQHQRRVNPKIHKVIKKEVIKLLDAGLIYPISDSPWVSPVHCVPKKGGMTVVENEDNELIPTRLVTGWRVCIDYRKLNDATRKDHFPLPFMDQMLERLAGNEY
ncbi:reverse transcriptase domain-containing protein [Tanacetum coccineum]